MKTLSRFVRVLTRFCWWLAGWAVCTGIATHAQETNRALRLIQSPGAAQWVQVPPSQTALNFTGGFTIEFWLRFEEWPSRNVALLSKGPDSWEIHLLPSGKLQFLTPGIVDPETGSSALTSVTTLDRATDRHVAVTWDPLLRRKTIHFNGALDAAAENLDGTLNSSNPKALPVLLGGQPRPGSIPVQVVAGTEFSGQFDEVRIWGTARSEDRLRESYNRRLLNTDPGLLANWTFDGTSLTDALVARPSGAFDATFLGSSLSAANLVRGVALAAPTAAQYALSLDGISEYVSIPNFASRTLPTTNSTLEAWIRPSSRFVADDVIQPYKLIDMLITTGTPTNLLAEHVWKQFSPSSRSQLTNPTVSSDVLNNLLVAELNRVLLGPSLYLAERFTGVTLRTETVALNQSAPTGTRLILLNRLLLEDYLPALRKLSSRSQTILSKGDDGFALALDGDRQLRLSIGLPTSASPLNSGYRVEFDTWTHVAAVLSPVPNTTNTLVTFFADGLPVATNGPVAIPTTFNNGAPLVLGRRSATQGAYFRGDLDEIRLWDRARSATEVGLFSTRELGATPEGLRGYWQMNAGSGRTVAGGLGNDLSGTVQTSVAGVTPIGQWTDGQATAPPIAVANLTPETSTKGLWIGQVTLSFVNEVHARNLNDSTTLRPTSEDAPASVRILLHVDGQGTVRLLKDVTLLGSGTDPADTNRIAGVVLVTNPTLIGNFPGIVQRGGKRVGIRHGSAGFDFVGNELPVAGGIGKGKGCVARIVLPANHPTNPFRHRYHPEHRSGYEIVREIEIEFPSDLNETGDGDAPGLGVDRLLGTYEETVTGLHKVPIKAAGSITLSRVCPVSVLNQREPSP